MANVHPNSIFRWEDAASLEHACWQCPTKANSPRALQTCYGVHSMPCTSYHPTMHAIGAAHRCSGCVMTREMHDARHREIAELVAEYRAFEQSVQETPSKQTALLERTPNIAAVQPRRERQTRLVQYNLTENNYLYDEYDHLTDDENDEDLMSVTSSTPSFAIEATTTIMTGTPSKKPTKAELRAQKKAKKSVKSQTKALKNQTRHLAFVTSADVEIVARILHGTDEGDMAPYTQLGQYHHSNGSSQEGLAHPLATDRTIEDVIARNLNFVRSIQAHKQYLFKSIAIGRKESKERKRQKKREDRGEEPAVEIDEVVGAIMIKLGIPPSAVFASASGGSGSGSVTPTNNPNASGTGCTMILRSAGSAAGGSTRKRAASLTSSSSSSSKSSTPSANNKATAVIAGKLRAAIKADLEKHENEAHMRYVRAGGFWRYVGKSVFERMTDIARELDVSTGEKWEKKWTREGRQVQHDDQEEQVAPVVAEEEEDQEDAMVVDGEEYY